MKKKQLALALGASVAASASLLAAPSSERYVYDASGNIVEKQIGDQVTQFDYAGNLLKESVLGTAQKQYQYDEAGRLVGELEGGQVVRQLNYQFADKVTKVQNGAKTTELFYNAEGQLVGTNSAGNLDAFAWDGLAMVSRGELAYANERHAVGGAPVLVGNDVTVSDMIGSTLSIGENSLESTAFGEGLKEGLLTGKPFVAELGNFVFKYRNYSPNSLRWLTADPSGFPDGRNEFQYVRSKPLVNVDLEGLETQSFHHDESPTGLRYTWPGTSQEAVWGGAFQWTFDPDTGKVLDVGRLGGITSGTLSVPIKGISVSISAELTAGKLEVIDEEVLGSGRFVRTKIDLGAWIELKATAGVKYEKIVDWDEIVKYGPYRDTEY